MLTNTIKLTEPQSEALLSDAKLTFFVGGVGAGKTFIDGVWAYTKITEVPKSSTLILAPSYDQLRNATLKEILDVWESELGLIEDYHFVINMKPPKEWGVKSFSSLHNTKVITLANGSYVVLDTADNVNKHRGTQYDYIILDEWRDMKEDILNVLIARMRGEATKRAGKKQQMFITTTPPDDPDILDKWIENKELDIKIVHSTPFDNKDNLPEGYIETLKQSLDSLTYRREVLGENVRMGSNACWSFTDENIIDKEINTSNPIWIIYDFDYSPQVILINQVIGLNELGKEIYCVVKEFVFNVGNTEKNTKLIIQYLNEIGYKGRVTTTGDYSGNQRTTKSNITDWQIIDDLFEKQQWEYRKKRIPTKSLRTNINNLNALFNNYEGQKRQYISKDCRYTIKDVRKAEIGKDGRLVHGYDNRSSHAVACLGDFAKVINPLRKQIEYQEF